MSKEILLIYVRKAEEDQKLGVEKFYLSPIKRLKLAELLADACF